MRRWRCRDACGSFVRPPRRHRVRRRRRQDHGHPAPCARAFRFRPRAGFNHHPGLSAGIDHADRSGRGRAAGGVPKTRNRRGGQRPGREAGPAGGTWRNCARWRIFSLIEADGARRLPLKAPATHEPVIPEGASLVVAVAGIDGAGRPVSEVHRPELYARLVDKPLDAAVTPEDIAFVLCHLEGQKKGVPLRLAGADQQGGYSGAAKASAGMRNAHPGRRGDFLHC